MALLACRECGKQISSEAPACPHCGAPRAIAAPPPPSPPQTSGCAKFALGLVIFVVAAMVIGNWQQRQKEREGEAIKSAMTPEQRAAADRAAAAEAAQKTRKEAGFRKVVAALLAIRDANRNPSSVTWDSIRANDDASLICIEYRGQNGFGGMNKEFVVFVKDAPSQKVAMWNKHCLQPLSDVIHARQALR